MKDQSQEGGPAGSPASEHSSLFPSPCVEAKTAFNSKGQEMFILEPKMSDRGPGAQIQLTPDTMFQRGYNFMEF